jgi:hypothetical protein
MPTLSSRSSVPSQLRALGRLARELEANPYQHPLETIAEFFRLSMLECEILRRGFDDKGDPLDAINR